MRHGDADEGHLHEHHEDERRGSWPRRARRLWPARWIGGM
jgi:hypothetical protein